MRLWLATLLSALLCSVGCAAGLWTSVKGERLQGGFVRYDFDAGTITIRRGYDKREFDIPEMELAHADRLKAVRLQNPGMEPYWYESYRELRSKRANLKKKLLFFYRNEGDREVFELYCHKLLLRPEFQLLLKRNDILVCIEEELPSEFQEMVRFDDEWHAKQGKPSDERPQIFYMDDEAPPRGYRKTSRGSISLMKLAGDRDNPFLTEAQSGASPFGANVEERKMEYRSLQSIEDSVNSMLKVEER